MKWGNKDLKDLKGIRANLVTRDFMGNLEIMVTRVPRA